MIQEDYVSYEVAKLLKEKGFDENTSMIYMSYGDLCKCNRYDSIRNSNYNGITKNYFECTAPTHQMAMKWLREKYYIYADPIKQGNYNDCSEYYTWIVARMGIIHRNSSVVDKLSYEEACEAALKYALENLI